MFGVLVLLNLSDYEYDIWSLYVTNFLVKYIQHESCFVEQIMGIIYGGTSFANTIRSLGDGTI